MVVHLLLQPGERAREARGARRLGDPEQVRRRARLEVEDDAKRDHLAVTRAEPVEPRLHRGGQVVRDPRAVGAVGVLVRRELVAAAALLAAEVVEHRRARDHEQPCPRAGAPGVIAIERPQGALHGLRGEVLRDARVAGRVEQEPVHVVEMPAGDVRELHVPVYAPRGRFVTAPPRIGRPLALAASHPPTVPARSRSSDGRGSGSVPERLRAVRWTRMRAPGLRVVLIAVAAVAVLAGGSLLTRHGPIGGSDEADGGQAGTATTAGGGATTPPTSLASLGTMSERLARLPALAPGELHGILDIGGNGCAQETLDLATLVRTQGRRDVCAVPGAGFGIRLRDVRRNPSRLGVVDLAGRPHATIPVPEGWDWWGVARQGVVFCRGSDGVGRLRRFRGESTPLPSCPLTQGRQGLLFRGPGKRSIVDEAGHRLAARAQPLS